MYLRLFTFVTQPLQYWILSLMSRNNIWLMYYVGYLINSWTNWVCLPGNGCGLTGSVQKRSLTKRYFFTFWSQWFFMQPHHWSLFIKINVRYSTMTMNAFCTEYQFIVLPEQVTNPVPWYNGSNDMNVLRVNRFVTIMFTRPPSGSTRLQHCMAKFWSQQYTYTATITDKIIAIYQDFNK